jgi:hypothetical protein
MLLNAYHALKLTVPRAVKRFDRSEA